MTGRRARGSVAATVSVLIVLGALTAACSGDDGGDEGAGTPPSTAASVTTVPPSTTSSAPGITQAEAIEIARAEWSEIDPSFDAAATRPEVAVIDGTYDVALVPLEIEGPGGEPHVVVDATTGEVLDAYQTL